MEHKCINVAEITSLRENVTTLYKKTQDNKDKIEKLEDRQDALYELTRSVAVIAEQITTIRDDVRDVKQDVTGLKGELRDIQARDGEAWVKFKWLVLASAVSLIAGFLFKMMMAGG